MNILNELKQANPELETFTNYKQKQHCYRATVTFGSGESRTTIVTLSNTEKTAYVLVNIGLFDDNLCDAIIECIENIDLEKLCFGFAIRVFNGVKSDKFNSVAILNHEAYCRFEAAGNPALNQVIYEIFPVMHYEFSGKETAEELKKDTAGFNHTNWNRTVEPLIKITFKMQSRTSKKYLKVDSYSLFDILGRLTDNPKYFVNVKNYLDEVCAITLSKKNYLVSINKNEISVNTKDIKPWLEKFILTGSDEKQNTRNTQSDTKSSNSDLLDSVKNNELKKVEALLADGADINSKDEAGYTLLMWAAKFNFVEMMKLLINSGAKIKEKITIIKRS